MEPKEVKHRSNNQLSFEIHDAQKLWGIVNGGTSHMTSQRSGYVTIGPDLGNLGDGPKLSLIDDSLSIKLGLNKRGGGSFYNAIPEELLNSYLSKISEDIFADGVNVLRFNSDGFTERIAFKDSSGNFIFEQMHTDVRTFEEFEASLDLAASIYLAYATAYYEEAGLEIPRDTLLIRPKELEISEKTHTYVSSNKREEDPLAGILVTEKSDINFKDIGGQKKAVDTCQRLAEQLLYPEVFELQGSVPPKGILLWGPHGTGKTLLAKAIANVANAEFLHVKAGDIVGQGLYGQSEQAVTGIFGAARQLAINNSRQVIIFIDEADLLLPSKENRHEATGKTVGIFAEQIDGLSSSGNITVILATNDPHDIDRKILSRMDESAEVPLPSADGLRNIFEIHLNKLASKSTMGILDENIDIGQLGEIAFKQKLSGRDVADIIGLISRQRGQIQLGLIKAAINSKEIAIPSDTDEISFIRALAQDMASGKTSGLENLILPKIRTEDLIASINEAKSVLKEKSKTAMGFTP